MNKVEIKRRLSSQISKDAFESKKILCEVLKNNIELVLKDYFNIIENTSKVKLSLYQNGDFKVDYSCVFKES